MVLRHAEELRGECGQHDMVSGALPEGRDLSGGPPQVLLSLSLQGGPTVDDPDHAHCAWHHCHILFVHFVGSDDHLKQRHARLCGTL